MASRDFDIASLTIDHSAALSALHIKGFAGGWSAEAIAALLDGTHCIGVGAFARSAREAEIESTEIPGPEILGFVLLNVVADEAEILSLVVNLEMRRRGIAVALMKQAIVSAKASGAASLFLEVSTANTAAIGLYEILGFKTTGLRQGYYKSDSGADAATMALRF